MTKMKILHEVGGFDGIPHDISDEDLIKLEQEELEKSDKEKKKTDTK